MNFDQLTRRERQVLTIIGTVGTSKLAAKELGISHRTVEFYLNSARQKLGTAHTVIAVLTYDRYVLDRSADYERAE